MNEQIRQLAEQAGFYYTDKTGFITPAGCDPAKFAELIVQECCDWIDGSPTSESGCQLLLTKSFIIANLKGHFGV